MIGQPGLLGGLWEFPTHDFTAPPSSSALSKTPRALIASLLASPIHDADSDAKSSKREVDGNSLRITQLKQAGSVLHIFSHIRKTYHGIWLVLEGGGTEVPALLDNGGKGKGKKGECAKWIREAEVDSAK